MQFGRSNELLHQVCKQSTGCLEGITVDIVHRLQTHEPSMFKNIYGDPTYTFNVQFFSLFFIGLLHFSSSPLMMNRLFVIDIKIVPCILQYMDSMVESV